MPKKPPTPRTLHEWLERNQVTSRQLCAMVKEQTGHSISEAMLSFILRGSRRCSRFNAFAIHMVTNVPMDELTRWPRVSESEQGSVRGQNNAA